MLNIRGFICVSAFIFALAFACKALSDGQKTNYLCDVSVIDNCARTGGLSR